MPWNHFWRLFLEHPIAAIGRSSWFSDLAADGGNSSGCCGKDLTGQANQNRAAKLFLKLFCNPFDNMLSLLSNPCSPMLGVG